MRSPTASTMPKPSQSRTRPLCDGKQINGIPPWPYTISSMSWPRFPLNHVRSSRRISESGYLLDHPHRLEQRFRLGMTKDVALVAHGRGQDAVHAPVLDDQVSE